jgi:hypothetical protein
VEKSYIESYINFQLRTSVRRKAWECYLGVFAFSLLEMPFVFFFRLNCAKIFLLGMNLLMISVLLLGTVTNRRDIQILSLSLVFSGWGIAILMLGYIAICSIDPIPVYVPILLMFLYSIAGISGIFFTRRLIAKGYFAKQYHSATQGKYKGIAGVTGSMCIGFGAISTGVVRLIARNFDSPFGYNTTMLIGMWVALIVALILSFMNSLYLCYYYMRKYKIK